MRDETSILDGGEAGARRVKHAMTCMLNQNNYGQRTGVNKDGTAFASTRTIAWGYNSKGEVVKADSSEAGLDRAYAFDGIGNRISGGDQGSPISYTPNVLNQYNAIGSLTPVHDDDGNMTSGPLPANVNANSTLLWDGENRLIQAQVNSGATVNFVYDSQSRRIAETVGSATTVYVYDGWNPIAEYNTTFALIKTYTWGLDLSGSMQGAGGVGGLLSVTDSTGTYFPTFDGNGNVSEYLDSTGNIVAHYEYDPFGKTTVATGSKANDFAHRFSTKPLDLTTGLYYYGYRFYDPETGRWPSRDPIGESGGVNLYGFVGNDSINRFDLFGFEEAWHHLLVQQLRAYYQQMGINIDAKELGVIMEKVDHTALHSAGWNQAQVDFALKNGLTTEDEVAKMLNTLKEDPRFKDLLEKSKEAAKDFDGTKTTGKTGLRILEKEIEFCNKNTVMTLDAVKDEAKVIGSIEIKAASQEAKSLRLGGNVNKVLIPVVVYLSLCDCAEAKVTSKTTVVYVAANLVAPIVPPPDEFEAGFPEQKHIVDSFRIKMQRRWNNLMRDLGGE
jgi:RHS repeat-associated protein